MSEPRSESRSRLNRRCAPLCYLGDCVRITGNSDVTRLDKSCRRSARNVLGKGTTPLPSVKKPIRRSYILPRTMVSKLRNARRLSGAFHLPLTWYFPTTIAQKAGPLVAVQNSSSYRPYLSLMARSCPRPRPFLQPLPHF